MSADAGTGEPRGPSGIAFEADYWQAVIVDVLELNDRVVAAAAALASASVAVIELALVAPLLAHRGAHDAAGDRASGGVIATMAELAAMHEPIARLIDLVRGRLTALELERDEAGR